MPPVPLIDVVLPAYNGAAMIRGAIESALAQEIHLRIIVVDDGSTDDSADIARSYGDRVHVIRQENQGVSGARNTALAAATAPYVAFLDQDDVWKPGKLQRQLALIESRADVGMVFTDMTILRPDGMIIEDGFLAATPLYASLSRSPMGDHAFLLSEDLGEAIVRENFISPSTTLVRSSALDAIGRFDTAFRLADDAECWMRLFRDWRGIAIEECLVLSYAWGGNASFVRAYELAQERIRIGEKVHSRSDLYPRGASEYFRQELPLTQYKMGLALLRSGATAEARAKLASSLAQRKDLRTFIAWVSTFASPKIREKAIELKRLAGWRMRMKID